MTDIYIYENSTVRLASVGLAPIIPYCKITVNALEDIFPSEYTAWGGVPPLDG